MASSIQNQGPISSTTKTSPPSLETLKTSFARATTLLLFLWPTLSLAVTNSWGGPLSSQKREWFAGTLVDLLDSTPEEEADAEWIEELLLQVMMDEFEVVVEDGSAAVLADDICRVRKEVLGRGVVEGGRLTELERVWGEKQRGGRDVIGTGAFREGKEQGDTDGEEEDDDDDEESEDDDGDVEMEEAPQLVRVREPVVPEVDADGFTKVTKKKR